MRRACDLVGTTNTGVPHPSRTLRGWARKYQHDRPRTDHVGGIAPTPSSSDENFQPPKVVILSGVTASRSKAVTESKDPYPTNTQKEVSSPVPQGRLSLAKNARMGHPQREYCTQRSLKAATAYNLNSNPTTIAAITARTNATTKASHSVSRCHLVGGSLTNLSTRPSRNRISGST